MTTIAPLPRAAIGRPASCVQRKTPVRLTASTCCQVSSASSSSGPTAAVPAWATQTSMCPAPATQASTAARTSARRLTSPTTVIAREPSPAAARASSSPSRSNITTVAPSAWNRCAMARPMPRAAPVTTIPLSVNPVMCAPPRRVPRGRPAYQPGSRCHGRSSALAFERGPPTSRRRPRSRRDRRRLPRLRGARRLAAGRGRRARRAAQGAGREGHPDRSRAQREQLGCTPPRSTDRCSTASPARRSPATPPAPPPPAATPRRGTRWRSGCTWSRSCATWARRSS